MAPSPTIADRVAQTVVAMHLEARADHRFHPDSYGYRAGKSAHDALAAWVNQTVPGWLDYYGRYYPTALRPLLRRINAYILRWARKKYKRLRALKRAMVWWKGVVQRDPNLFRHWPWTTIAWMTG